MTLARKEFKFIDLSIGYDTYFRYQYQIKFLTVAF